MNHSHEMTFFEHLIELRFRLLKIILSIIIFSLIGYYYSNFIITFLLNITIDPLIDFQVLKVTSIFMTKIIVSIFIGLILSLPIILYQILIFLLPAFKTNVTKFRIIIFVLMSFILFIVGLLFGYFVLLPLSMNFFKTIAFSLLDYVSLNYTLENYLVYLIWALIISSFIYQLPVIIIILVKMELINIQSLIDYRSYAIVSFFIISALFTPPDPLSQLFIALPLIILYEVTILVIKIFKK